MGTENKNTLGVDESQYELMKYRLSSAALGIAHWDMDVVGEDPVNPHNKFTWSPEFRGMLGFSDESDFPNILSSWSSRLHPDDRDRTIGALAAHINDRSGKIPYDIEYRLMLKTGEYRYFHDLGATMRDADGAPLWTAGAIQDVTDKKLVEARLAEEYRKSEEMAHWYKTILDAIPFPVSVTDANKNWTFVNKGVEDFLKRRREDIIGLPCSTWNLKICNTPDCGIACAERGLSHTFFSQRDLSYKADVAILRNMEGGIAGFIKVVQDITEVEHMARRQADAANEAKSLFLATMSHEIRTPLNAIIGMTAIGKKSSDTEVKNYSLTKIEDASTNLLGIINDILDMSKIEANKLELSPVEFNFERMLQKLITVINFRVVEKRQRFSVNIDRKVPRLLVSDDQRLAQVITNLLSNAVKFTPVEGEISLTVSLLGKGDGVCELKVEVADNGIGISPEQQKKLFSAFGQAESGISREFGGTGLGLAISKRIVELMNGSIWVESEIGKGSHFIFTVKVPYGEENPRAQLARGVEWESVRILVVDDSLLMRKYFGDIFNQLGINCETAQDGLEACKIIKERGGFDLYFVDWRMPRMDGLELTKWIKTSGKRGTVVLISSAELEEARETSLQAGADKCLIKPFVSSTIIDCLNECFGTSDKNKSYGQDNEFAGKTLLIVEDIEINREILMSLLENTGLSIDCAENGEQAVNLIGAAPEKYNVVLMDMQMPVMDGLEATRRIRAMPAPQCAKLPIIAMTANVFRDDIDRCLAAGMNDHLGKPIGIEEMFEKLRKVL